MTSVRSADTFVRPPRELLDALADAAGGAKRTEAARWVESGSNTLVLLTGARAIRIARQRSGGAELLRAQALVDALPPLPFQVPRSIGAAVEIDGLVAVPTQRIDGSAHPAGSGDPDRLRSLIDAVSGIDVRPLEGLIAEPRSFLGGAGWQRALIDAVDVLAVDVRPEARRRVAALVELSSGERAFVHGDLAGGNVLWVDGRIAGVLDWDLATCDDPAIDVAALAGWHGWGTAEALSSAAVVRRAAVFRHSGPLQALAFLMRDGRPSTEVDAFAQRVAERLRRPGDQ